MENAQLIGLSRQVALKRQLDVIANNLANMNTSGFKGEKLLFDEYVMPEAADNSMPYANRDVSYTEDWATMHDMEAGAIRETGNPLNAALNGDGFFSIQTPAGVRYTRNGEFNLNAEGTLVTNSGNPVLVDGGPITFQSNETDINISSDGTISSSAGTKGSLDIVSFDNPQDLAHEADTLFVPDEGVTPFASETTSVIQGAVEASNVSGVTEMANMINVTRTYQQVANFISRHDELRTDAINKLGNLNA